MTKRSKEAHALFLVFVGFAGWLIPGGGHLALNKISHAVIIFCTITITFLIGLYVGSIGVIDPVGAKPWYVAQVMNTPAVLILGHLTSDNLLFSISSDYQSDLNRLADEETNETTKQTIRQRFCDIFEDNGISLSEDNIRVLIRHSGYQWQISDNQMYFKVVKLNNTLNIHPDYSVYGRPAEIGQTYTSIAGLLNLLCIINAVYLANLKYNKSGGE